MHLILSNELTEELSAHICEGYPFETCGTLIGKTTDQGTSIQEVRVCKNLNKKRREDRFDLDPDDFLQNDLEAQHLGLDIVGIWHSHPDHPAIPSTTDLQAAWPNWSYLIASVSPQGIQAIRSWRLTGQEFEEEAIYNHDHLSTYSNTAQNLY